MANYFSGQGKLYVSDRSSTGGVTGFKYLGNVPELTISLETDIVEHTEAVTGNRVMDYRLSRGQKCELSFALEEFTANNLVVALYGVSASVTGATATNENMPTGLAVGDFARLRFPNISAVSVVDSAGTPATLTANTHYKISSAKHGTLEILNIGSFTQPFRVSYTYATHTNLTMFTGSAKERFLRFEGLNTADTTSGSFANVVVELYRVIMDPLQDWGLIQDDLAKWTLSGSALYDSTRADDTTLGGFGRVAII